MASLSWFLHFFTILTDKTDELRWRYSMSTLSPDFCHFIHLPEPIPHFFFFYCHILYFDKNEVICSSWKMSCSNIMIFLSTLFPLNSFSLLSAWKKKKMSYFFGFQVRHYFRDVDILLWHLSSEIDISSHVPGLWTYYYYGRYHIRTEIASCMPVFLLGVSSFVVVIMSLVWIKVSCQGFSRSRA